MPALTIRDIPSEVLEVLRERARQNRRSLNGEIVALLETSARAPVVDVRETLATLRGIQQRYAVGRVDHAEVDDLKRRGRSR